MKNETTSAGRTGWAGGRALREGGMNDATLQGFRDLANVMAGPEPRDWEWIGVHMSQRMFGITERRATEYASIYGGTARKMPPL